MSWLYTYKIIDTNIYYYYIIIFSISNSQYELANYITILAIPLKIIKCLYLSILYLIILSIL